MPEHKARGKSKKAIATAARKNIHELAHGPHHADRVRQQGAAKAHEMEVAAAFRIASGRKTKPHPKGRGKGKK